MKCYFKLNIHVYIKFIILNIRKISFTKVVEYLYILVCECVLQFYLKTYIHAYIYSKIMRVLIFTNTNSFIYVTI